MKKKALGGDFAQQSGAAEAAYNSLRGVYAKWQAAQDAFDAGTGRSWMGHADVTPEDLQAHRNAMTAILNDPKNNVPVLLKIAEQGAQNLPPMDQANLREMNRLYAVYAGYADPKKLEAFAKAQDGAADVLWEAYTDPVWGLMAKQQAYKDKAEARAAEEGRDLNNRERNRLATYDVRLREAKQRAFEQIKPKLVEIFTAQRALLAESAKASGLNPSDLVTSEWNPNVTGKEIDAVLDKVRGRYPDIMRAAEAKEAKNIETPTIALPPVPIAVQRKIFERIHAELLAAGGWDQKRIQDAGVKSEFKVSNGNSMCWGTPSEYYEMIQTDRNSFIRALGQNMPHEPGHELYLLNLHEMDPQYRHQPVGRINGYSTHEVCAMTMDSLGNTRKYYELAEPIIRDELRKAGMDADVPAWAAENLYLHSRKPQGQDWSSGNADCLPQVAWRVKAERAFLDGPGSVEDAVNNLPQLWADTMTEYTGTPHDPKDFAGIEEDHWFTGMAGYFWAYQHGAMGAAMIHQKLNNDGVLRNDAKTLKEYFEPVLSFLKTNINDKGRLNTPMDTLRAATGMEPSLDPLIAKVTGGAFGVTNGAAATAKPNARRPV